MDKGLLSEGMNRENIKFDQWRSLGVEFLCKAVVKEGDKDFTLEAYLYDTSDGTLLPSRRDTGPILPIGEGWSIGLRTRSRWP